MQKFNLLKLLKEDKEVDFRLHVVVYSGGQNSMNVCRK